MKKIIVALFIILLLAIIPQISSNPNPIQPHFINEFMFDSTGWKLEIYSLYPIEMDSISLDGGYLTSSTDTVYFNNGIYLNGQEYLIVTQSDMQSQFNINPSGDILGIFFGEVFWDEIYFGVPGLVLHLGQSMNIYYYSESGWSQTGYYLDNSPTFGAENDTTNSNGNIEGFIKDSLNNPLEGVKVIYGYEEMYPGDPIFVETNSNGYFIFRDLSILKKVEFEKQGYFAPDTLLQIWPDSTITININMTRIVGISEINPPTMNSFTLSQNYPNPFNSTTTFLYSLQVDEQVEINIYDEKGELVQKLFKGFQNKGEYRVRWNADNLASGIYFYELKTRNQKISKKCLLLK